MSSTERIGVLFALRDDVELVQLAEDHGYESVWTAEGQGKSAFGKLERWAAHTSSVKLGTGIVNVFSRTPAALAQAAATLDEHSGGRALLGLGVAHPGVVEGFHGAEFDRPLPRMDEYITLVRRYISGVAEPFDGEFFTPERTSFWDAFEPTRAEIPIYNAALGPANIRLTGQFADGWLPNLYPLDQFEEAMGHLETGAKRAGRDVDDIDVAMYVLTVIDEDPAVARQLATEHVVYYLRDIPGYYGRPIEEAGYEKEVEAIVDAADFETATEAVTDGVLDTVAVWGTPEEARERLVDIRTAGVDLPIVRAAGAASRDQTALVIETFAPES